MLRRGNPYSVLAMLVSASLSMLASGCTGDGTGNEIAQASPRPTATATAREKEEAPAAEAAKKEADATKVGGNSKPNPARGGILDADEKTTGKIDGVITYAGEAPKLAPIPIPVTHKDRKFCGGVIRNEEILLGEKNTLANVVVSLVKVPNAKPKPRTPAIANVKCVFEPRVLATTKGSGLKITSKDPGILHNAHGYLGNEFNIAITSTGQVLTIPRLRTGWTLLLCDIHSWMKSHVWVFDHDFFAVTGKDGKFSLEGVPPGEYDLLVWHEKLAFSMSADAKEAVTRKIKVTAGDTSKADFELKPKK